MNQRRQIMVDSKMQFHFFWLWIAVSAGILAVIAIVSLSKAVEQLIMDAQVAETLKKVFWITGGYILTLSIVFGAYTIFHLHRIAGPAFRLRRCVEGFLDGDFATPVTLRKKDYLQDLAAVLDTHREKVRIFREGLEELRRRQAASGNSDAAREIERLLNAGRGSDSPSA